MASQAPLFFQLLLALLLIVFVSAGVRSDKRRSPTAVNTAEKGLAKLSPELQKVYEEVKKEVKELIEANDLVMFSEKKVCLYCVQIRSLFEKFQTPYTEIVLDEHSRLRKKNFYYRAFVEIGSLHRTPAMWAAGKPIVWEQKQENVGSHTDYLQPVLQGIQRVKALQRNREIMRDNVKTDL